MQSLSDFEEEEEEIIVVLKFPELESSTLQNKTINIQLFDEGAQIIKCNVGEMTFQGKCELSLGSQLLISKSTQDPIENASAISNMEAVMKCTDFGIKCEKSYN